MPFRLRDSTSCAPVNACSAGENRYETRQALVPEGSACAGEEKSVSAMKDKRGNWTLTPKLYINTVFSDGGTVDSAAWRRVAPQSRQVGAEELGGLVVNPLETEQYSYQVARGGRFAMQTTTRPGGLSSSVETTYTYDDVDGGLRLTREVTAGSTLISVTTGSVAPRLRATFYRPIAGDSLQRVQFIEGPCWVDSKNATTCSTKLNPTGGEPVAGWWPIVKFEYYGTTTSPNSQRLAKTIRYPAGLLGRQLVTEYSNYTPEGDPGKVRSYSVGGSSTEVVDTDFLYSARRPVSQRVYRSTTPSVAAETLWFYDEDQVTAVRFPEKNYEVMCYRKSAFPNCTGSFTKRLRWRAKTNSLSALAGWSERVEYDYDSNGYQTEERRFVFGEAEPRLRRRVHPDLQGRATYSRSGGATSLQNVETKAHFDGADNRDAYGPPANVPPDYCRSGASDSPLCWWFRYDRANRLNQATAPGSPALARNCFDYDAAGNIRQVTTGDSSVDCNSSLNSPGTLTAGNGSSTALQYVWDDFGNVIEVTNTGTHTSGRPPARYRYDAQGNVIERATVFTADNGKWHQLEYDGLGRLLRTTLQPTASVLSVLEYDTASAPPFAATRQFLSGRLARRIDSFGSTWYGYDYLGRTISEYREKTACNLSKGGYCRPHTFYGFDGNGNLQTITYPFGRVVNYKYGGGERRDRATSITSSVLVAGAVQNRTLVQDIAWEPYGGLRGYTANMKNATIRRAVEYYLSGESELDVGACDTNLGSSTTDGTGRVRGLFVGVGQYVPSSDAHVPAPHVFAQRYRWNEDQIQRQTSCVGSTRYDQDFSYDQMQRLTNESMTNFPAMLGESASESKVFDARGNRIDSCRDGYCVQDAQFDINGPDRLAYICWWRNFLSPGVCFIGYGHDFSPDGVLYGIYGLKDVGTAWSISFDYPFTTGLADVYSVATRGVTSPVMIQESFYDAFGRRRHKRNAVMDGQEFIYDLGHQLLVDVNWKDSVVGTTSDEYVWLDGRPVLAFRSNLTAAGVHSEDFVGSPDTTGQCSRPLDDGTVNCGLFHLVSNLQGFVNVAMWDWSGQVASLQLPDADGTVNEQRFNSFGGWGTSLTTTFNVPATYSKQSRFRTSWTGGVPGKIGVTSFELNGSTVLSPNGAEIGQAWSQWSPVVSGTTNVTWTTTCTGDCASAVDLYEWKAWETGSAQFHTKLRFPGQYHDVETAMYENWNRYYDHHTGRYFSPERVLHNPSSIAKKTTGAQPVPAYSYARDNPLAFIDPDGLEFINSSSSPVKVKSESGGWGVVPPHQRYPKKIDGWEDPFTKKKYKVPGKEWVPFDNRVQCSDSKRKTKNDEKPKVRYDCTGGPCRLSGIESPPDLDSRSDWQPADDVKPFSENERL